MVQFCLYNNGPESNQSKFYFSFDHLIKIINTITYRVSINGAHRVLPPVDNRSIVTAIVVVIISTLVGIAGSRSAVDVLR